MDFTKYDYFMKRTEQDLDHIRLKVDKLWDLRLMLIGGSFLISGLSSALVSMIYVYLEFKK